MDGFLSGFSGLDRVFFLCAFGGGLLFLARLGLAFFIGDHHDQPDMSGDVQLDAAGAGDADVSGGDAGGDVHADHFDSSGVSFKLLTIQGLTAFFLMFGLIGLALHHGSGMGELQAIIGGLIIGGATMLIIAKLTQMMRGLYSSGNINVRQAIGQTGTIYLNIPDGGAGQVEVCVQSHLKVMDAVAEDRQAIKTGERVQVVNVIHGNTLVVRKA